MNTRRRPADRHRESHGSLGPGESPGFLLWRATLRWQRTVAAALRPLRLTHVQFVLLACTWWLTQVAGERPTQRRVADFAATDPMMTSQVIRALEARGLVRRVADPQDSRALQLTVTGGGARLAREAVKVVEAADAEFFIAAGKGESMLQFLRSLAG